MAAFRKGDIKSNEAGVKFFIIGVLSTAVMLFGMSLIYGVTGGATQLNEIAAQLARVPGDQEQLALAAILFVVVGSRSRSARCPSSLGTGHVRGRAGACGGVPGGRLGGGRVRGAAPAHVRGLHRPERVLGTAVRLLVGSHDVRRQPGGVAADPGRAAAGLLGIAQAGYILLTFALVTDNPVTNQSAFSSAVAYILIYGIMNLGAFAVAVAVSRRHPTLQLNDFAGLARRLPCWRWA